MKQSACLIATLLLTGCAQVEQTYRSDPAALQQVNVAWMVFAIALGVVGVAWAVAWAFVNRKQP